ncbi:phenazine biosynthesis protein [Streptomyces sp. NPDC057555]|uniref:phenazine biosynthesis protein n=1 Tax=Streptomyces sp. NPDC057555 TaxID=3346166 RepID=UPI0036CD1474
MNTQIPAPLVPANDPGFRADDLVQAAMDWHFSPDTGSRFWLEKARTWSFAPRKDITTLAGLALLPDVTDEIRRAPVGDLVPKGLIGSGPMRVFETGGTTGRPRRIIDFSEFQRQAGWWSSFLDREQVPLGGNWLLIAPTGPHAVGHVLRELTALRSAVPLHIDLDPRWVKELMRAGRSAEAQGYVEHLVSQTMDLLTTQTIDVMFCTPPLLEVLAQSPRAVELINRSVHTILWSGASMDRDTRDILRHEVFPEVRLRGAYGNTITGVSPEYVPPASEPLAHDDSTAVFIPCYTGFLMEIVDPATAPGDLSAGDWARVPYGARGRVLAHTLTRETLLPNNLERDIATRIAPLPGHPADAVADVAPFAEAETEIIEGVY